MSSFIKRMRGAETGNQNVGHAGEYQSILLISVGSMVGCDAECHNSKTACICDGVSELSPNYI